MKAVLFCLLLWLALPLQAAEGRVYTPGPFTGIEIGGAADVYITQGETEQVFVEGDAEAQKSVSMTVRGGVLRVDSSGSWKFWNSQRMKLHVSLRDLTRLSISGAADVKASEPLRVGRLVVTISGAGLARFDQLQADQLSFSVSGAGDGQVAGQVREMTISISGKSDFQGEHLMARKARVSVSGIGDVKVWVVEDLTISVAGIGSVDYWGTPNVRRSTSGVATVNDRGAKPVPPAPPAPPAPHAPNAPNAPNAPAADVRPAAAPLPTAEPRPVSR